MDTIKAIEDLKPGFVVLLPEVYEYCIIDRWVYEFCSQLPNQALF